MKLTPKFFTFILIAVVIAFSFQTYALAGLSQKLENAQIRLGAASPAVSFSDDGSTPDMVGGC